MEKYQGFKNRDTWLTVIWLQNEFLIYQEFHAQQKRKQVKGADKTAFNRVSAKRALRFGLKNNLINDPIDFKKVNFDEVARAMLLE